MSEALPVAPRKGRRCRRHHRQLSAGQRAWARACPKASSSASNKANADPAIKAMVLMGDGRSFIAGADIRGFGTSRKRPPIGERTYDVLDASHEAGRRGDPRLRAGRRAGERDGLPLPHRRPARRRSACPRC